MLCMAAPEMAGMYAGTLAAIAYHISDRYLMFKYVEACRAITCESRAEWASEAGALGARSPRYNYVIMGLILSSFAKLALLLMVIWDYDTFTFSWMVQLIVLTSNAEALSGTRAADPPGMRGRPPICSRARASQPGASARLPPAVVLSTSYVRAAGILAFGVVCKLLVQGLNRFFFGMPLWLLY